MPRRGEFGLSPVSALLPLDDRLTETQLPRCMILRLHLPHRIVPVHSHPPAPTCRPLHDQFDPDPEYATPHPSRPRANLMQAVMMMNHHGGCSPNGGWRRCERGACGRRGTWRWAWGRPISLASPGGRGGKAGHRERGTSRVRPRLPGCQIDGVRRISKARLRHLAKMEDCFTPCPSADSPVNGVSCSAARPMEMFHRSPLSDRGCEATPPQAPQSKLRMPRVPG